MVKVTQNLWKECHHNNFRSNFLGSSWLWGSNSCLLSSHAGFKSCRSKGFFQIGMIIKLSLGSTYPNTVQLQFLAFERILFFQVLQLSTFLIEWRINNCSVYYLIKISALQIKLYWLRPISFYLNKIEST